MDYLHCLSTALLCSPLVLSLILYSLYYVFPGFPPHFYLTVLFLTAFILPVFLIYKAEFTLPAFKPSLLLNKFESLSLLSKTVLLFTFLIFILCGLRILFWPINWDDQIYYIEQSYAFGSQRSVSEFFNWGFFDNGVLKYQYNPAIRPAIPILYSIASLFSRNLSANILLSKVITGYFTLVFIMVIWVMAKRIQKDANPDTLLVGLFLIFTTYLFVNLTVLGFKELPLLCLALLIIDKITSSDKGSRYSYGIYIGILLGLMSFINLSGTVLASILILMTFFSRKLNKKLLISQYPLMLISILISSGMEFSYFFAWVLSGGSKETNVISLLIGKFSTATNLASFEQTFLSVSSPTQANMQEYASYNINSAIDAYTKGKLQGFFQLEYYGIIFLVFLIVLVFRYKYLITNTITKYLLIFLGLYYLIILDIFGINRNKFAYVMTVSHKYTVLIVPIIALIIVSQWAWLKNKFAGINLKIFSILNLLTLLLIILLKFSNYTPVMLFVNHLIPVHNSPLYYYQLVEKTFSSLAFSCGILVLLIGISVVVFKEKVSNYWKTNNLSGIFIILIAFMFPFLILFNSNFGIKVTLLNSFSDNEYKLAHIIGWEDRYTMINFMNKLPKKSKILFYNQNYELYEIHLNIPSKNIYAVSTDKQNADILIKIDNAIKEANIKYLLINTGQNIFPKKTPIYGNKTLSLFSIGE